MKKYNITVNGVTYEVIVEETDASGISAPAAAPAPKAAPAPAAAPAPKAAPAPAAAPAPKAAAGGSGSINVCAPMPGTILKMAVSVGQKVEKGGLICILEAMKMENEIFTAEGGTVASIVAAQGSSVNSGDVIVTLN